MNGYKIVIWSSTYFGEKWSHNNMREEIVHARNEKEAGGKVTLKKETVHSGIKVSAESIYRVELLGMVRIHYEKVVTYVPTKKMKRR